MVRKVALSHSVGEWVRSNVSWAGLLVTTLGSIHQNKTRFSPKREMEARNYNPEQRDTSNVLTYLSAPRVLNISEILCS